MSARFLRLVGTAYDATPMDGPSRPVQLSLFDVRPRWRVLCLPMRDLHGQVFARAVRQHRPDTVVDLRSHPYFDLHALGRDTAFAIFGTACATYRHRPLDLRPPATQAERWRMMRDATALFGELTSSNRERTTFALLLNRPEEIPLIEGALTQTDPGIGWQVVGP